MVRVVMEYGALVWQGARNTTRLDEIQRKGLALCLNLPQTSGRETMEVAAGLLPIDLRLEEIAVRELAKIQAKKLTHRLKKQEAKMASNRSPGFRGTKLERCSRLCGFREEFFF